MNESFLKLLQKEAQQQKKLYETRILPKQFDPLTSFIGENSFLSLVIISFITAVFLEFIKIL